MTLFHAALLGVVQGLTEFLPISSSAHLILARALFGWDAGAFGLAFDVACHVGTLLAVILFFWRDLWSIALGALQPSVASPGAERARLIVVGTVPIVIVGLLWADNLEGIRTPLVSAFTLAVGALGLLWVERLGPRVGTEAGIGYGQAFALGCAQAAALVPGVSRSGATITAGMLFGLRRDAAARFSFLLGVPAVVAAAGREALELRHVPLGVDGPILFAIGVSTSAVVGYLTIKYFLRYLGTHRLDVFAYYRLALAFALMWWFMAR
ncbi:MAG: undecaprenyl-diphosphate phosphatase [Vicinamibacterales bacterium]